jgi:ABC-2 type transport system ATP-binding protein
MTGTTVAPISIRGLTKRYGRLLAVDGISFEVRPGEVFGFLGLNGAGKTTTIRMLLDLLRPTAGGASIFGNDCQRDGLRARELVGYLPGETRIYDDMTGEQALRLFARLGGGRAREPYRRHLLERLELTAADLRRQLRQYSSGMKRKLGIVLAFQDDPPLLILDEPTEGLDPLMQEVFYDLAGEVRRRGRTIFMSSHVLSEVERVCDRIAVLRKGTLALLAPVNEVRLLAPRRVRVVFERDETRTPPALPDRIQVLETGPRCWDLRIVGPLGPLLEALRESQVADLHVDEPRLEDVLIQYYRGAD